MRIATSVKTVFRLANVGGTIISGVPNDITGNADYSKRLIIRPIVGTVSLGFSGGVPLDYIYIGGFELQGAQSAPVRLQCGSFDETVTLTSGTPYYFDMSASPQSATIILTVTTDSIVSLSVFMGGESAEIPNGGVTGGQSLNDLKYNNRVMNTRDNFGNPTSQIVRPTRPNISWNFPNLQVSGSQSFINNIRDFYRLINEFGVAPVTDGTQAEGYTSYAVYAPSSDNISYDNRSNALVSWSLSAKAAF